MHLIYVIINVLILAAILYFAGRKSIVSMFRSRRERIDAALTEAETPAKPAPLKSAVFIFISDKSTFETPKNLFEAEKIDVYSLGVTLYNLTFGCYPYDLNKAKGNDYEKIKQKVNNNNLIFPTGFYISDKYKNFLTNILEKDYKKRYNIKEALEDPWIKGWDIINEEKENTGNLENFIIKLICDNIPKFNQYIK